MAKTTAEAQVPSHSQATSSPQQHRSSSPPTSTSSSPSSFSQRRSGGHSPLSLSLSDLPPLSQPSPPSNTLLITQLSDLNLFHPASLATIRQHINDIAPLHSFAPLKSLRRIICSFFDIPSAIAVRQSLDGSAILGEVRTRVYFGEPTPIENEKKYLERPDAGRLFFISPPPSPPIGWEMRNEDAPNKEVHADDLASKLAALTGKMGPSDGQEEMYTAEQLQEKQRHDIEKPLVRIPEESGNNGSGEPTSAASGRTRSRSSTVIYDPEAHGDSPALPAVKVEDYTADEDVRLDTDAKKITANTSRPPVELMED